VWLIVFALIATSVSRLIVLAEVTCHASAAANGEKFVIARVMGVLPLSALLMTITVSAASVDRMAAKVERLSGLGAIAETLVSPKVILFPS
jgi:hypothetical protein